MGIGERVANEVEEVKGNTKSETIEKTEKTEEKRDVKDKEEKKEVHRCDQCKWYDVSTQRDFHRDGIRKGLVEVRAVCRSPTSKARNHLIKNDSDRPCFEEGVYVKPQKQKKKEQKTQKTESKDEEKTSPSEYHGPPLTDVEKIELKKNKKKRSKRPQLKRGDKVIVTDPQNGETKTFEQQGHRLVLVKQ